MVGGADIIPGKARKFFDEFEMPDAKCFESAEELLKLDLDAVSGCTYNTQHCICATMAMEAGCNVLVEKPMCLSMKEAETLMRTEKKTGKFLTVGFQPRYGKNFQQVKSIISSGILGDIYYVQTGGGRRRGIPGRTFIDKNTAGVGSLGDIGCYSYYPTKNLGGMGDGGMAITNSTYLKDRMIALRNHGGAIRYYHDEIGVNSRLDEIQATVLNIKLKYIDEWNKKRRENAYRYNELLEPYADVITPKELDNTYCVYHQYTVKVPNRDEVHKYLLDNGVGAMIYYPVPLHLQKAHAHLGYKEGDFPITEANNKQVLSLPMFPEITEESGIVGLAIRFKNPPIVVNDDEPTDVEYVFHGGFELDES